MTTMLDCAIMQLTEGLGDLPLYSEETQRAGPRSVRLRPREIVALIAAANAVRSMREALALEIGP